MSPLIAAHAASFIGSGIGKSGKPCARLIAPYWLAIRVISRITDSVKLRARAAVAALVEITAPAGTVLPLPGRLRQHLDHATGSAFESELRAGLRHVVVVERPDVVTRDVFQRI